MKLRLHTRYQNSAGQRVRIVLNLKGVPYAQMDNARRFGCDLSRYPRLVAVDTDCRALDAFVRAAPEAQPDYPGEQYPGL